MGRLNWWTAGIVLPAVMLASPAAATQEHVVDTSQLRAIVAERQAQQEQDRAAIREALGRSEVRQVAKTVGADMDRLTAAIDTFSTSDLERAADAARQVNDRLVGGASSITISTTTLIIGLLVLILLIVALK